MTPEQEAKLKWLQEMILKIRTFLATTEPVLSLSVNGMSVSFDRKQAWEELKELERQEANLLRPNRRVRYTDLSNAF